MARANKTDNQPQDAEEADAEAIKATESGKDDASNNEPETPAEDQPAMADETKADDAPPPGVYVEEAATPVVNVSQRTKPVPAFSDEHVGIGGRYRINEETGAREPVYEKYTADDGSTQYRKAF